ncbi:MAG TPA: type II secretion system F family protein [Ilumatobacteraceae bacterium]
MTTMLITSTFVAVLVALVLARAGTRVRRPGRAKRSLAGRRGRATGGRRDYAGLLDSIARQVRSGTSLAGALVDSVGTQSPLDAVVVRLARGDALVEALSTCVGTADPDLALTVHALSASARLGGPVAATLDDAAAVLRERAAARAERVAQASQARLSARVLTVVPLAFAAWTGVVSDRTRDVYFTSAAGAVCALCGLMLNATGWIWMKRIIGPT